MSNRHVKINNANRFLRDPNAINVLHENKDNTERQPAETICGLFVCDALYYNEMKPVTNNPVDTINLCIYCHGEMRNLNA